MFDKKTVLITGGTGSFGHACVKHLTKNYRCKKIIIFSRDEMKQWNMQKHFGVITNLRYFLGDVRDKQRLARAVTGVDYVIHAAATKIVPTAEYNPFECIKTNITGAMNLVDVCIDAGVKKVVALSTDKASSPVNLYGATKLVSDKVFVAGNAYSSENGTKFAVVRYGNVMGSRGSVIPFFLKLKNGEPSPITDPRMTRFMISLEDGIELVKQAFLDMVGGEIYVKKIPSMNISDIAEACRPNEAQVTVGIRVGEKIHEQMIGESDAPYTYEYPEFYKILPAINDWHKTKSRIKDGIKVAENFSYSSQNNNHWLTKSDLKKWVSLNSNIIGKI